MTKPQSTLSVIARISFLFSCFSFESLSDALEIKPRSVLCEVLPSIFFFCFWKNIINGKNYTLMWSYITNQHLPYNHVKYWDIRTHFEIQIFWHLNSSWRGRNHWKKRKTFAFVQRQKKREKKRENIRLTDLCRNPHTIFHKQNPSALGLSLLITARNHFFSLLWNVLCIV